MRIGILTTRTTHHKYFINKISEKYKNISVFFEKAKINKYSKLVQFEKKRKEYEEKIINKLKKRTNINYFNFDDIEDKNLVQIIKKNCDYIIVFGTSKIKGKILNIFKNKIFNFHAGNPQKYRGLDSHYWCIYHNDFKSLDSTIHILEKKFDTGKIIYKKNLKIDKNTKLYQLRMKNTKLLTDLSLKLFNQIDKNKKIISHKQKKLGRYYSYMPFEIKLTIEKKFNKLKIKHVI